MSCVGFSIGLIHANHGGKITDYLLQQLKEATTDVSCFCVEKCILPWSMKTKQKDVLLGIDSVWKVNPFTARAAKSGQTEQDDFSNSALPYLFSVSFTVRSMYST